MWNREKTARKRHARPTLDGLESRELLSTASLQTELRSQANVSILSFLPGAPSRRGSTNPGNGDQNPYGVAFVPNGVIGGGVLQPGDLLVSNFNNGTVNRLAPTGNLQGTGRTIVRVTPQNTQSLFYQPPVGVGFSNGLSVLKNGYVIAGFVPSTDGTPATVGQGGILVLDKNGHRVAVFSNAQYLNGPWGLTVVDHGNTATVFVANVLSGTVSRFNVAFPAGGGVRVVSATQIGSGYAHHGDPAAFEVGPGGLAYDALTGNLYVASEADDSIYVIPNALRVRGDHGTGRLLVHDDVNLHGPIGLTLASDGHLIAANSDGHNANPADPSTLVEYTRGGRFLGKFSVNPNNGGAFAVTITSGPRPLIAYINDVTGTFTVSQIHGTHPIVPFGG